MKTNIIYNQSAEHLKEPDNSVDLIITSPPYNAGIGYDAYDDNQPLVEYRMWLRTIFVECYRVLKVGGRICINVSNIMKKPFNALNSYVIQILEEIGFLLRGEIVWLKVKGNNNGTTAWGSWQSPSNPWLRDSHEFIIIASKMTYNLQSKGKTDLTAKEFSAWTRCEWSFSPVNTNNKLGHPAPFPEELPRRLIKLYSWLHAVVLDPFCGSGTTCYVAKMLDRQYIGYDISKNYCDTARSRISQTFLK